MVSGGTSDRSLRNCSHRRKIDNVRENPTEGEQWITEVGHLLASPDTYHTLQAALNDARKRMQDMGLSNLCVLPTSFQFLRF